MMNFRFVAQHALTLLLALSVSACLTDSATNEADSAIDGSNNAAVSLTITSPSSASVMDTVDTAVSLAGTASSDMGIFKVDWANDRGGEGIAAGTDSWQTASIALELGENKITITAEDTAGSTTSRSIVINRETGHTGSVSLSWVAPTARTDSSPLTNLTGYKLYYGRMSGIYDYQIDINNPGVLTYIVEDLASGDWYFALTAYDSEGLESDRSNEVLRQIS
jgi:hypothetical protein